LEEKEENLAFLTKCCRCHCMKLIGKSISSSGIQHVEIMMVHGIQSKVSSINFHLLYHFL